MKRPKSVVVSEAAQTQEVIDAGVRARAALYDTSISDAEADAIIMAYNAMPHAVPLCTRAQYAGIDKRLDVRTNKGGI